MTVQQPPEILKLLSHDLRWTLVQRLTAGDYRVHEMVSYVGHPLNLVSYHLKQLRDAGLVATRRSEADGRDVYYSLNFEQLQTQYYAVGTALHPSLRQQETSVDIDSTYRVLFVCTHNSARSQMAEGLLRHLADNRITVRSAGSEPGHVHPDAIETMNKLGIDIRQQQSQGFEAVADETFDFVITVCDQAREVCPTFPGDGQPLHWGLSDPAVIDDPAERQAAFMATAKKLQSRIRYFLQQLHTGAAA